MIHDKLKCQKCGKPIEWDCRCQVMILESGEPKYMKLCKKCKEEVLGNGI